MLNKRCSATADKKLKKKHFMLKSDVSSETALIEPAERLNIKR